VALHFADSPSALFKIPGPQLTGLPIDPDPGVAGPVALESVLFHSILPLGTLFES